MISTVLCRLALSFAQAACGGLSPEQPVPTKSNGAVIKLRQLEPLRVAYRAHKGTYWTIGPLVREVRAYMVQHRQPGPLFIRYLKAPRSLGASLETEIGFILHDEHEPSSGFQTATRKAERVASMTIEGRSPAPSRDYAVVFEWVERQGLSAAGPVTELYPADSSLASRSVEIQIALSDARDAPPIGPQSATPAALDDDHGTNAPGAAFSPQSPQVASQTTTAEHRIESPPTIGEVKVTAPPSEVPPRAKRKKAAASPGRAESIESLIAAERFDQAARVLLPDEKAIDPALLPWIDGAFARLHAAARGIRRVYPGEGATMLKMAGALTRRLAEVSSPATDRSPGIVPTQDASEKQSQRRRIIHELDVLLSRIALRIARPAEAAEAMKEAVRRIDEVIRQGDALDKPHAP